MSIVKHKTVLVILLICCLTGCVTIRQERIKLPYQVALESYNAALSTGTEADLNAALAKVDTVLLKQPSDLDARVLRANIYLRQIAMNTRDQVTAKKMIRDLQVLSASLGAGGISSDWAQARCYVVFGDFILLQAREKLKGSSQTNAANDLLPWQALIRFEAAKGIYAYAYGLATKKEDGTLGLKREASNAYGGYASATQGIIASLDRADPGKKYTSISQARKQALDTLQKLYAATSTVTPGVTQIGFDPSMHRDIGLTYTLLVGSAFNEIKDWCGSNREALNRQLPQMSDAEKKLIEDGVKLAENRRQFIELAAVHTVIQKALEKAPSTDTQEDLDARLVKQAYELDLKSYCEIAAN